MFTLTVYVVNTGVPGGYNANVSYHIPTVSEDIWLTRKRKTQTKWFCKSEYIIHKICIVTSADLSNAHMHSKVDVNNLQGPMFHNKYFMERDHTVMDCMEEQLVIRNKLEYQQDCLAWLLTLLDSIHAWVV